MEEIWKPVKNYEKFYEVSNKGRVKSFHIVGNNTELSDKGKIINGFYKSGGYIAVNLTNKKESEEVLLHRLVAKHFIPNPKNKRCINHIDCDKTNNCVNNLEWCTYKENHDHARKNGLYPDTYKVAQYTLNGELVRTYDSCSHAAEILNVDYKNVSRACKGNRKSFLDYQWEYYENEPKNKIDEYSKDVSKKVHQLDNEGNTINTFNTLTEAANDVGLVSGNGIGKACRGEQSHAAGYQWKFAD